MSSALDLVVLNGPLEGTVVQLDPRVPLVLGRARKGLQLIDPLVSLVHAEITWEGDRYWVQDRASATGTFVNDVRLAERAVVLVPGMRIRLGETDLEVRERPKSMLLRVVGVVGAVLVLVLGVRSVMESIDIEYDPVIRWFEPVKQGAGYESPRLRIPTEFIRTHGIDHRDLKIDQVTDYDGNGISELWLAWPDGREVVTFRADGDWQTMATLRKDCRIKGRQRAEGVPAECYQQARVATGVPESCRNQTHEHGFPDLDCTGTTYRFVNGRYQVVQQDGVFAWMPPTTEIEVPVEGGAKGAKEKVRRVKPGPPEPALFTMVRPEQLAGFLVERGVAEPVHYVVCEDAVAGIRPQALTDRGEIVPMSMGCAGDVFVQGPTRKAEYGDSLPVMFAFTGVGYDALLQDLAMYLSGFDDPAFMSASEREVYDALAREPMRRTGGVRLAFQGPDRVMLPIASEEPLPARPRRLLATEFAAAPPVSGSMLLIDAPGRYDLRGCGELDVQLNDWHCLFTKGCTSTSTFARMQVLGCAEPGPVVEVPYQRGVVRYKDENYVGSASIESLDADGQIDVLRLRFAYRLPYDEVR
jgi:hypothetical protein